MGWKIEYTGGVEKQFYKYSKDIRTAFVRRFDEIQKDPFCGRRLKGEYHQYLKVKFRFKRNDYRIVYQIIRNEVRVLVVFVGTREGFYQRLRRLL